LPLGLGKGAPQNQVRVPAAGLERELEPEKLDQLLLQDAEVAGSAGEALCAARPVSVGV
jgi:hypothetical protein